MSPPRRPLSTGLSIPYYGLTREEVAIIEESLRERTASREVADDEALEPQT